jgi:hypothetical protein
MRSTPIWRGALRLLQPWRRSSRHEPRTSPRNLRLGLVLGRPPRPRLPCCGSGSREPAMTEEEAKTRQFIWRGGNTPDSAEVRLKRGVAINPQSGCWEFSQRSTKGYGLIRFGGRKRGAHRLSYETWVGPIPDGLFVLHRCDNRRCINPDHLFLGTARDNAVDMVRKGRHVCPTSQRTHCPQGHPYDAENTRLTSSGRRECKICSRNATRRWRQRQAAKDASA